MDSLELTPLERALISAFHDLYRQDGFPPPDLIRAQQREQTPTGRYVGLQTSAGLRFDTVYLDLDGAYVEMDGVPHGMTVEVHVKHGQLQYLEIATYRAGVWDGVEREWTIDRG